jgi:hypothetical protein
MKLTKTQKIALNDIVVSLCLNNGRDGFKANKRTLESLEGKGLITYGKFPKNGPFKDIGWQATDEGINLNSIQM